MAPTASDDFLRENAAILTKIGARHGLRNFGLGREPGELVAEVDVSEGRSYFDVFHFEDDIEEIYGVAVEVTPYTADEPLTWTPREWLRPERWAA
ncbi:hypothetical protein [Allostreptomyces psammosilenae]|uniref:Uncharacterized protein n=1 Tax=Allostreptomyces psammosilenae TaxID=1892865 RepID=A0A853A121_9ACTN|nr:hypothetical protein [Allostreptomyces psammosilenae]NYI08069.1 hypothetical protein [Allostreptomyces psammosilenae]